MLETAKVAEQLVAEANHQYGYNCALYLYDWQKFSSNTKNL